MLLVLNGAPGTGKSTLATAFASRNPQVTALDVDAVKHSLESWPDDPQSAGLEARRVVLSRAEGLLADGQGVAMGQFIGRPEFIDQLEDLASRTGARFEHVVLSLSAEEHTARLEGRRSFPTRPEQAVNDDGLDLEVARENAASVDDVTALRDHVSRLDASGSLGATLDSLAELVGRGGTDLASEDGDGGSEEVGC